MSVYAGDWRSLRRPVMPMTLNASSPQARGLVLCWVPIGASMAVDLVSGQHGNVPTGTPLLTGTADIGLAVDFDGTNSRSLKRSTVTRLPIGATDEFTVHAVFTIDAYVSLSRIFGFGALPAGPTGKKRQILTYGGSGDYYFYADGSDWDTGIVVQTGPQPQWITFTRSGNNMVFYLDGRQRATNGTAAAGFVAVDVNDVTAGGGHSTESPDGRFHEGRIYNRCLTAGEVWELYDPRTRWDLYQRRSTRVAFNITSGSVGSQFWWNSYGRVA